MPPEFKEKTKKSRFMSLFRRNGGDQAEPAAPVPAPAPAAAPGHAQENADPELLEKLYGNLNANRKTGFLGGTEQDSNEYTAVKNALGEVNRLIAANVDHEHHDLYRRDLDLILQNYDTLIGACQGYLEKTVHSLSINGRARRGLVKSVLEQAESDSAHFNQNSEAWFKSQSRTWKDALRDVRTEAIDLRGRDDISIGGAGASVRVKIGSGENTKWFTKDTYNVRQGYEEIAQKFGKKVFPDPVQFQYMNDDMMIAAFDGPYKLVDFEKPVEQTPENLRDVRSAGINIACRQIDEINTTMDNDGNGSYEIPLEDAVIRHYCTIMGKMSKDFTAFGVNADAKIGEGRQTNQRNTATSRMADLLGIGNLVARSKSAEVTMPDGKKVKGSVMDQARGKSFDDINSNDMEMSDDVQRQLICIEYLDMICGQIDRHANNLYYQMEGNTVTGVQAIDNDVSFGTFTDLQRGNHHLGKLNAQNLPFADRELAARIRNISDEVIKHTFGDLLSEPEISALCTRIHMVREHLAKLEQLEQDEQRQANPPKRRMLGRGEWAGTEQPLVHANFNIRNEIYSAQNHKKY